MKVIDGGINAPIGFEAAGIEAGIKYENRKDMAIIYSQKPCVAAGTFTSNIVKAAPVKWDMDIVDNSPYAQAVIVNTGIANAIAASPTAPILLPTTSASAISATDRTRADEMAGRYCLMNICFVNDDILCIFISAFLCTYLSLNVDACIAWQF